MYSLVETSQNTVLKNILICFKPHIVIWELNYLATSSAQKMIRVVFECVICIEIVDSITILWSSILFGISIK